MIQLITTCESFPIHDYVIPFKWLSNLFKITKSSRGIVCIASTLDGLLAVNCIRYGIARGGEGRGGEGRGGVKNGVTSFTMTISMTKRQKLNKLHVSY